MDFKLAVSVEQKGIAPTAKNLESLAKASDKAAPAVERLSSSLGSFKSINLDSFASKLQDTSTAIKEVKAATSGMADMAKNIGGLSINLTNIANATDRISGKTKELDSFTASIRNLKTELEGMKGLSGSLSNLSTGASTRRTASSGTSGSSGDAEGLTKAQQRLQTQIERTAMMAGKTKSEYLALRAAQEGITSSTSPFIAKIAEVENKFKSGTMSTKQYNAAMRMVPAQFTDIATQLAGGQNPMLILLQQGGQLKDMFQGNVLNALKAVGSYLTKLLTNPLVLLAAAVAGISYGLYKATMELDSFNKATTQSNGIIGLSKQGYYDTRDALVSLGASRGNASEALIEIAKSGRIASDDVLSVGNAAIKMSAITGTSIKEAVSVFADLQDKPVETLQRLDRTMNILSYSSSEAIKNLVQQGKSTEAAALATKTLQEAIDSLKQESNNKLEGMALLFDKIGKAANKAVNDVMKLFDSSQKAEVADLTNQIAAKQALISNLEANPMAAAMSKYNVKTLKEEIATLSAKRSSLQTILDMEDERAGLQAATLQREKDRKDNQAEWDKITAGSLKLQSEKLKEKNKLQEVYNEKVRLGTATEKDKLTLAESLAATDKNYKTTPDRSAEKAQRRTDARELEKNAIEGSIEALQAEIAALDANGLAYQKANQHIANAAKWRAQANDPKVSPDAKSKALENAALEEQAAAYQDIRDQMLRNTKAYESYNEVVRKNEQDVADLNQQYEQEAKYITMTTKEKAAAQALFANEVAMNKELLELQKKIKNVKPGSVEEAYLDASIANTKAAYAEKAKSINAYLALQEKELSWQDNLTVATKQYAVNAGTYNQQVQAGFISVFGTVESALENFVTGTNTSFKDLTVSVLKQISIMMAKIAMMKFAMAAIGMFSGSSSTPTTTPGYSAGDLGSGITLSANGNAFTGTGIAKFAKGSAFTNSVVKTPTPFMFASGGVPSLGVMGEKPGSPGEAVMPLTRTANGNLGVETTGTGGVQNNVSVNITMSGDGSSSTSTTSDQSGTKRFAEIMAQVAKNTILQEQRPGGSLATR